MAEPINLKDRVRQWYFENQTMKLSDAAEEFGIPYETVRDWGKKESWRVKRIIDSNVGSIPKDIRTQADGIRFVLFEHIMSGEYDAKDLNELVKAWKSMVGVSEQPDSEDSDYVDRDELMEMLNEAD